MNALGDQVDGLGGIDCQEHPSRSLESVAPSIMDWNHYQRLDHFNRFSGVCWVRRIPVWTTSEKTSNGKTAITVEPILYQTNAVWVYISIGQKNSPVAEMLVQIAPIKDMEQVIVVLSGAAEESSFERCVSYSVVHPQEKHTREMSYLHARLLTCQRYHGWPTLLQLSPLQWRYSLPHALTLMSQWELVR